MLFRPGEQIGPYVLKRELGRGAFGSVWLAQEQSLLEREVALKLPLDDDPDIEDIKREAQTWLRAGNHPNLVPVLNAGIYEGQIAIASEFVSGGTLTQWLRQQGGQPPSTESAVTMVCGILAGLEHLHTLYPHPLVHRDLKPANVMVSERTLTPRITDFGISRVLKTNQSTNISGTPAFMSPEMFDGRYSAQSDQWAVGVMLYQMLTGRLPFDGANMIQLARSIERDEPPPLPAAIPAPLREAVRRSMQKDPAARFASAQEMQEALRSLQTPKRSPQPSFTSPVAPVVPPAPSPALKQNRINPADDAKMIFIPAGVFPMGEYKPYRMVTLHAYYIYKNLVTVTQFRKFCQSVGREMRPAPPWGWQDNHPIIRVTWEDAKAYCDWAGAMLPTEAQWEKAAHGTDGRKYPWGNEWDSSKLRCSLQKPGDSQSTAPVGSYPEGASPYGVLDMAGNVMQWCSDWYEMAYSHSGPTDNPTGPETGTVRALRGGAWNYVEKYIFASAYRYRYNPTYFSDCFGFRCVVPADSSLR